jgi:shikimate kinase
MSRIYLVGLPGTGKSTSGKRFAKKLGWGYADLDKLVEMRVHQRIPDIFKQQGEAVFRATEASCLRETGASHELVVGCGGGAASWGDNIDWMLANGQVIWLNIKLEELVSRLTLSRRVRPMFPSRDPADIFQRLETLLTSRVAAYARAHKVVESETALLAYANELRFGADPK